MGEEDGGNELTMTKYHLQQSGREPIFLQLELVGSSVAPKKNGWGS